MIGAAAAAANAAAAAAEKYTSATGGGVDALILGGGTEHLRIRDMIEEEKHGDMRSRAAGAAGGVAVIWLRELSVGARAHVDVCGRD